MRLPSSSPLTRCLAAAACLTTARAQDWEPLAPRIVNHSREAIQVHPFMADPGWTWGYSIGSEDPTAFPSATRVTLPPARTLQLVAKRPEGAPAAGSVTLRLDGLGAGEGSLRFRVEVNGIGAQSRIRSSYRTFGQDPSKDPLLMVYSDAVLILPQETALPERLEAKGGSAEETKAGPGLTPLAERDRLAGVDSTVANYTMGDMRQGWSGYMAVGSPGRGFEDLHSHGNVMPEEMLAEYFLNSLFSYNTKRWTGWEPGFNYGVLPTLTPAIFDLNIATWVARLCNPPGVHLLEEPKPGGDFKAFMDYHAALERAMAAFKKNPRLLHLGIAYMRQKIVTEKLRDAVRAGGGAKAIEATMYEHDKLAETLQTLIFNWMKEGYGSFVRQYRDADAEHKPGVGDFLEGFVPDFIYQPECQKVYSRLRSLSLPAARIGSIELSKGKPPHQEASLR